MLPGLKELNLANVLNVLNGSPVASTEVDADITSKMRLMSCSDEEIAMVWQKRGIQGLFQCN